jgi:hypothetical protein
VWSWRLKFDLHMNVSAYFDVQKPSSMIWHNTVRPLHVQNTIKNNCVYSRVDGACICINFHCLFAEKKKGIHVLAVNWLMLPRLNSCSVTPHRTLPALSLQHGVLVQCHVSKTASGLGFLDLQTIKVYTSGTLVMSVTLSNNLITNFFQHDPCRPIR